MKQFLGILLLILHFNIVKSQNYKATHYDEADGIASKTIYAITQSPDGFIWIATDLGLYRFDGQIFQHYLIDDGLTDNEILDCKVSVDNLMYYVMFNGKSCYYFKNKFYDKAIDTTLKNIKFKTLGIADINKLGNEIITYSIEDSLIFTLKVENNKVVQKRISVPYNCKLKNIVPYRNESYLVFYACQNKMSCAILKNNKLEQPTLLSNQIVSAINIIAIHDSLYTIEGNNIKKYLIKEGGDFILLKTISLKFQPRKFFISTNGFWLTSNKNGAYFFENDKIKYSVLTNSLVNAFYQDANANIWLGTVNNGLYYLKKSAIQNSTIQKSTFTNNIESIATLKNSIFINDKYIIYSKNKKEIFKIKNNSALEEIKFIHSTLKENELIIVANKNFITYNIFSKKIKNYSINSSIKSIINIDKNNYFVATHNGLYKLNVGFNHYTLQAIWNHRITTLFLDADTNLWIGTLNSLFLLKNKSLKTQAFNDAKFENTRINSISTLNDTIYIATDRGIFVVHHFHVLEIITKQNLLVNDNCLKMMAYQNKLYVVNSYGLNILEKNNYNKWMATNFISTNDGLLSNQINDIAIAKDTIYLATTKGLSYYSEKELVTPAPPLINILILSTNNQSYNIQYPIKIKSKEKNITISFTGISYQCSKNMTYKYKLINSEKNWVFTKEKTVSFFGLEPGNYTFEVKAINEKGKESTLSAKLHFEITPTFWQTIWFKILLLATLLFIVYYAYLFRIRTIKKREVTKADYDKRLSQIELEAIKAQINPHFIYNCLNSIQNSILKNDMQASSLQISLFSKLIRETLNLSKQNFITLDEEINYLTMYLQMEKIRFKEKLEFTITCKSIANPTDIEIPSMLLQPFVENAVKHGISNNQNAVSTVQIHFEINNNELFCTIEDNGLGIIATQKIRENTSVPVGLQNVKNRVETYNKLFASNINVNIDEKTNNNHTGTLIKIVIPLKSI